MAQILPYYSLCPLIEQESFLGLMKDVDGDTAVVTVNANIISRYKISDPKLLSSWNCKGRITSACVYEAEDDRYIAVFNENELRIWTTADKNLDKVKKYRFAEKLHKLLICPKTSKVIVVFRKGSASYLESVLENRKSTLEHQSISSGDEILSCDAYVSQSVMVVFIVRGQSGSYRILSVSPALKESIRDVPIRNPENMKLIGHCLFVEQNVYLLTLWSNGKLYRDVVGESDEITIEKHLTSIENVDLERNVIMKVLSPYYVAICGPKDDGILLIIFSTKYSLIQCQQYYDNCQMLSQLWNFESKLFLIIGHNLVVAPYIQESRKLSTLLGSNVQQSRGQLECVENLPEAEMCKNIVPPLLENNDIEGISKVFEAYSDIPDTVLIDILHWSLQDESRKKEFLDKILTDYSINDIYKLRTVFNVDSVLDVLDYLMANLSSSNVETKLVKWASLFIDAFYSQLIMSNDTATFQKLKLYVDVLHRECNSLENYKQLNTVMSCVKRKKIILI